MLLQKRYIKIISIIVLLGIIGFISVACISSSDASLDNEAILEDENENKLSEEDEELLKEDKIYKGVTIEGIDVSSLSREEAISLLKDSKDDIANKSMELVYKDKSYFLSLKDIDFEYSFEGAVEKAYAIGRKGKVEKRLDIIRETEANGFDIPLKTKYSVEKIKEYINEIASEIDIAPIDANFSFNNGKVSVTDSKIGLKVDFENLEKQIKENIFILNIIDIPVVDVAPSKTKAQLGRINGIIGEFSTNFRSSTAARATNIRLSSNTINGTLLMPGESFSFNETVGRTTEANGYRNAPVIVNGELVDGVGGGICQTSTTLYNAAVRADLTILSRRHHSLPISYVPLGHDAAVSYGGLDLRLRNDYDFPIFINSRVSGTHVYFYIYGDTSGKNYSISLESKVIEKIDMEEEIIVDKTMKPGAREVVQVGRNGYKVETYKVVSRNGKIISRSLLNNDYYRERKQIVKVGPEKETKPEPEPEPEKDPVITIKYPNGYDASKDWEGDLTITASVDKGILKKGQHTFTENGSFTFIVEYKGKEYKKTVKIENIVAKTPDPEPPEEPVDPIEPPEDPEDPGDEVRP